MPDLEARRLTPGVRRIAEALTTRDWPAITRLKLSEPQIKELGQYLHGFLIFHLGHIPKGRAAAIDAVVVGGRLTRRLRYSIRLDRPAIERLTFFEHFFALLSKGRIDEFS